MHKNAKKVEWKTRSEISCHYTWLLHSKNCLKFFLLQASPVEGQTLQQKEKKRRKRKGEKKISSIEKNEKCPLSQDSVFTVVPSIKQRELLRRPGIELGSTAWKAAMLTTIPPTLWCGDRTDKECWFLVKSGQSKFWHGKSALIWNPLLIRLPPWTDQGPPSCPSFFRYELSMFSDSPFTRRHLEEKLIRYMTQQNAN